MNKLIASIVVISASLTFATTAFAQAAGAGSATTPPTLQQKPVKGVNEHKIMMDVIAKLNLTPAQTKNIKSLVKESRKASAEVRKSLLAGTMTRKEAQPKQKEIRQNLLKSIKGVLTPDQTKQFETSLKEAMQKAREAAKAAKNPATTPPTTRGITKSGDDDK